LQVAHAIIAVDRVLRAAQALVNDIRDPVQRIILVKVPTINAGSVTICTGSIVLRENGQAASSLERANLSRQQQIHRQKSTGRVASDALWT